MSSHLGIDVGTTSIKVCIVRNGVKVSSMKVVHGASVNPGDHLCVALFNEQDPRIILNALDECMCQLKHSFEGIHKVSVTGQMHGILLWKRVLNAKPSDNSIISMFDALVADTTNLITWQDQRCDSKFLNQFPPSPTFCKISTGFGIASLAWLQKECNNLGKYDMCGTIMDFIVWILSELDHVTMTSHNANSWGYFDMDNNCWEIEKIKKLNIDIALLPKIVPLNVPVGNLKYPLYGIGKSAVVYPSLGDMQCSIRASRPLNNEAVINIGTSSQVSFIAEYQRDTMKELVEKYPSISIVPYNGNDVVISAASLTGGNVVSGFATNLQSWMTELGCKNIPSNDEIFEKLEETALAHQEHKDDNVESLRIIPRLFGERFDPNSSGIVSNIKPSNCSLGSITYSLYEGIIRNLSEMLPVEVLKQYGVNGVCATGGALVNTRVMMNFVKEIYDMTLRVGEHEDGSLGAAIFLDKQ